MFRDVRPGHRILFDDGKIEGMGRSVHPDHLGVVIERAAPEGSKLRPEKGVTLPDSVLSVPALSADDLDGLAFAVAHADLVGLSFAHRPEHVAHLQRKLAELGRRDMAVILKIETRLAIRQLPRILLAEMRRHPRRCGPTCPRCTGTCARGTTSAEHAKPFEL